MGNSNFGYVDKHDEEPCSSKPISLMQRMIAASSGAIITSLTMTPMDVVKIRLQQQAHPFVKGTCFLYHNGLMDHLCTACADSNGKQPCEWFLRPGNFTGTLDAFVKISRTEGIISLWSGLSPTLVMAVPATVFYYAVYDNLLIWLREHYQQNHLWLPTLAGAAARTLATTFVSPLEMVRTKMQSERLTYYEICEAVRRAKSVDGWLSFWRGWAPTLMRDLPFSAIYWTSYEYLKGKTMELSGNRLTIWASFFCGALSGAVSAFFTTPFDVAKTQRQITLGEIMKEGKNDADRKDASIIHSKSTYAIFKEIVQKRGFRALFAGVVPRIVKIAPACAIMIGFYENAKTHFGNRNRHRKEETSTMHSN